MESLPDYEKFGSFYLGKKFDLAGRQLLGDKVLYDAKDLTTHAMCVGMTGSGKTGLCLSLLEEAAIDGIPAICIAPKGTWETCCSSWLLSRKTTTRLRSYLQP